MEKNVTNNIKLIDLDDALTILFITLKLCGVIDWSWWLVLLPTIITTGFSLATVAVVGIIFGGVAAKEKIEDLIFDAKLRKLGKGKTKRNKKTKNDIKTEEKTTTTNSNELKEEAMKIVSEKQIINEYYEFQDLPIREKIQRLEFEKAKLLNLQNIMEDQQLTQEKIKQNNRNGYLR